MTTGPAASRLQDNSLLGPAASVVAVVAVVSVCRWTGEQDVTQYVVPAVLPLAVAIPPAIQLRIKSRRRDTNVDIARIERGELRRPVALVVMLLAAAIILLESVLALVPIGIQAVLDLLFHAKMIDSSANKAVGLSFLTIVLLISGMGLFLVASYASHYFAKRPYLWTATAVACALAIRGLAIYGLGLVGSIKSVVEAMLGSLSLAMISEALVYLGFLLICMVGVWLGGRYHDAFLSKKLARMEGKAARQHQSTPQSQTTETQASAQDSNAAPKLATLVSRPTDIPSAPDNHRTSDPIKQIEKLAHLRDAGALTDEEFQAKKTEILCRI